MVLLRDGYTLEKLFCVYMSNMNYIILCSQCYSLEGDGGYAGGQRFAGVVEPQQSGELVRTESPTFQPLQVLYIMTVLAWL
jgi:hypothetical protein